MKKTLFFLVTMVIVGFSACSDDDDKVSLPDITVNLASTETGISTDKNSAEVVINLSRQAAINIDVTLDMTAHDALYGQDFTTDPAASESKLTVTLPAGSTSATIVVNKKAASAVDGADYVKFTIEKLSLTSGFKIGDKTTTTVYFGPIFSTGDQLTLNGRVGSEAYRNSVYVDFSRNSQVAVDRKSWNLAFNNGSDFRVILNAADATTAIATDKTDINAVGLADAEASYDIGGSLYMTAAGLKGEVVDKYDGDLSGTAFAEVSANDAQNKVYLVAPESSKASRDQWYKVKVNRSGNGYSVQYAKVGDSAIKTVEVPKTEGYNLSFISFDKATTTSVEPQADKWDIMWSYYTGDRGDGTAYFLQDMVAINYLGGAQAAQVSTETVSYANFAKADLEKTSLSSDREIIGSKWRSTSNFGGGGTLGIFADRFYVVKDPEGNYYKLRFLKMGLNNDGGERGRPVIEYALIDK